MPSATRRGFVITVAASAGGTAKSVLTLNLACYLGLQIRDRGKTVCLVDTNFEQADTRKYLGVKGPSILGLAQSTSRDVLPHLVHRPDLGISALLGPDNRQASPGPGLYNQALDELRDHYDYVLIDAPVAEKYSDLFTRFALPRADRIAVPVHPNLATLMNADAWLRSITDVTRGDEHIDPEKVRIIFREAPYGCSEEEARTELDQWTFAGTLCDTDEWFRAQNSYQVAAAKGWYRTDSGLATILEDLTDEPGLHPTPPAPGMGFLRHLRRQHA